MFGPNASWSLPEHLFQASEWSVFQVSEWSAFCTDPFDAFSCRNALQTQGVRASDRARQRRADVPSPA
jgi:hypothetical protein